MSYEVKMLDEFQMPAKEDVGKALLKILFKHNGIIKEFNSGQEIVDNINVPFVG